MLGPSNFIPFNFDISSDMYKPSSRFRDDIWHQMCLLLNVRYNPKPVINLYMVFDCGTTHAMLFLQVNFFTLVAPLCLGCYVIGCWNPNLNRLSFLRPFVKIYYYVKEITVFIIVLDLFEVPVSCSVRLSVCLSRKHLDLSVYKNLARAFSTRGTHTIFLSSECAPTHRPQSSEHGRKSSV